MLLKFFYLQGKHSTKERPGSSHSTVTPKSETKVASGLKLQTLYRAKRFLLFNFVIIHTLTILALVLDFMLPDLIQQFHKNEYFILVASVAVTKCHKYFVLVTQAATTKMSQAGWLKQQKFNFSHFWIEAEISRCQRDGFPLRSFP